LDRPLTPAGAHAQSLGELGERVAEKWLREKGWRVLQRRFRSGHRDIDLIVERNATVAFVEVKCRSGLEFGSPVEAVNWFKQKQIAKSASSWISLHGRFGEAYRFDVVGVWVNGDRVRVRHVENAFDLSRR
jgi:putative endonuclease